MSTKWLRQSTAVVVPIGPFVDDTDAKTFENALTISRADVRLRKHGGTWDQKSDVSACTFVEFGNYDCALNVTDTGTLGPMKLMVPEAGALPYWEDFMVVPANVFDSFAGVDKLDINVSQIAEATAHLSMFSLYGDSYTVVAGANNTLTTIELPGTLNFISDSRPRQFIFDAYEGRGAPWSRYVDAWNNTNKIMTFSPSIDTPADETTKGRIFLAPPQSQSVKPGVSMEQYKGVNVPDAYLPGYPRVHVNNDTTQGSQKATGGVAWASRMDGSAIPSASDVLSTFKVDSDFAALIANANGQFIFEPPPSLPGTGTLTLRNKANTVTVLVITLQYNVNGYITSRTTA